MLATIASSYCKQLLLAINSVFRRLTVRPTDCENLPGIWTQNLLILYFFSPCLKHGDVLTVREARLYFLDLVNFSF